MSDQMARRATRLDEVRIVRNLPIEAATTLRPRPVNWTTPEPVITSMESAPQLNTRGNEMGSFGDGLDDTVLWPVESAIPASGLTLCSDYVAWLEGPSRSAMATTGLVPLYQQSIDHFVRRGVQILNYGEDGSTVPALILYLFGPHYLISQDEYEILPMTDVSSAGTARSGQPQAAESVAIACVDPAADNSEFAAFYQIGGVVYGRVVTVATEDRNYMSYSHFPGPQPEGARIMTVGDETTIASFGEIGNQTPTGDLFYSSLQAVAIGDNRVLLLNVSNTSQLLARVVTVTNGAMAMGGSVEIFSDIQSVYQAVSGTDGRSDARADLVGFTARRTTAASGRAGIIDVASGTPVLRGSSLASGDFSHFAWCADRAVVIRRPGYNAAWGASHINAQVYDTDMNSIFVQTLTESPSLPKQTAAITGFSDGRLVLFASSFEAPFFDLGDTYEAYPGAIRLFSMEGDTFVLRDQITEQDGTIPSAQDAIRLNNDVVIFHGRTGETYDTPPGDEQPMWQIYFCGGVFKSFPPDATAVRLSNDWMVTLEPQWESLWPVHSPGTDNEGSVATRAIRIDRAGAPDLSGMPVYVGYTQAGFGTVCRLDDTHYMTYGAFSLTPGPFVYSEVIQVLEVDTVTGDVAIVSSTEFSGSGGIGVLMYAIQPNPGSTRILAMRQYYVDVLPVETNPYSIEVMTIEFNASWEPTIVDVVQVAGGATEGGGATFTYRNPIGMKMLTERKFAMTWVHDIVGAGSGHWSAHAGGLLSADGALATGTALLGARSPDAFGGNAIVGYQGYWMHEGAAIDGRYAYFCGNEWDYTTRFTSQPSINVRGRPCALVMLDVDDVTADMTAQYYPFRVDPDAVTDPTFYNNNHFFYTSGDNPHFSSGWPATADGYVFFYADVTTLLPSNTKEFWMFQGPVVTPLSGELDGWLPIAKFRLDEIASDCVYVPDSESIMMGEYFLPYKNTAFYQRDGLIACFGSPNYHSRAFATGWSPGFGAGHLRLFGVTQTRGSAEVSGQLNRVWSYGGPPV